MATSMIVDCDTSLLCHDVFLLVAVLAWKGLWSARERCGMTSCCSVSHGTTDAYVDYRSAGGFLTI